MSTQGKVVLFLVDGMRPDAMMQAEAPFLHGLVERGASTLECRTIVPSSTLPCHTSLFLGVEPTRHGIVTNTWSPPVRPIPGLIETLQQGGKKSVFCYNWEPLRDLARPEALNAAFFLNNFEVPEGAGDVALAQLVAPWLGSATSEWDFAFVYLGFTDTAGHQSGWMSEPYLRAIGVADRCIAHICAHLPSDCHILVTADHGGHDKTHGTDRHDDVTTPLVISGPSVPAGHTITRPAHITDIAPTIAALFGIPAPAAWIGAPVTYSDL
ncbi:MAG: sulfatase [Chthonomonadales bacterium]|nr:sulfatase [Chthonomonadales bacterium]